MKRFKDYKIGARLTVALSFTFIIILVCFGWYTISSQRNNILKDTETRMFEQVNDLVTVIEKELNGHQEEVENALKVGEYVLNSSGNLTVSDQEANISIVNQTNSENQEIRIPKVHAGLQELFGNTEIVDQINKMTGVMVTIFQKIPQGYLRIATSIRKEDGTRSICTYIPNNSPVAQALNNNETYSARAMVMGEWCLTSYKPVYSSNNTKIVVGTAIKEQDMASLKAIFMAKKYFKSGYPYLINKDGDMIIHPTSEGKNIKDMDFFKQMSEVKTNEASFLKYTWEGKNKHQYFRYIPSMESYVAVTIYESELMDIINKTRAAIIIAILLGITLFIITNFVIIRSVTQALRKGVDFTKQIASGNLKGSPHEMKPGKRRLSLPGFFNFS